jgi:hypothetical protein
MPKSNLNFGVSNHESGQAQRDCGLNPDHGPDLSARQFHSLPAVQPEHVTVLR